MSDLPIWDTKMVNILVTDIPKRFGQISSTMKTPKTTNPALVIIEAILSINKPYDTFVVPTLNRFKGNNLEISSLHSLLKLVDSRGGPEKFFKIELEYYYPQMANTFYDVLRFFISIEKNYPGTSEYERLHYWAINASPRDYKNVCSNDGNKIYGFGIATFQYIRMLLGADTIKPDRYIKTYIEDVCGNRVSEGKAVYFLEEAAKRLRVSPKELDNIIWNRYARGS